MPRLCHRGHTGTERLWSLILKKEGEKIVVQAKRYSSNVGIEDVQQVFSAKANYNADELS
jgi:HJR/Mrr/RecB family endonuclease